jgi:HPt (histidine-containing phosphotransfer) domain-containing protein
MPETRDEPISPPVLDLNDLRARCLGNESMVTQILGKVERSLQQESSRLAEAWSRQDFDAVAATAHRLKGTAANVGAEALYRTAEQLDEAAREGRVEEARRQTQMLEGEVQRLTDVVNRYHAR